MAWTEAFRRPSYHDPVRLGLQPGWWVELTWARVSIHDLELRHEIEAAIAEAVARFGMAGDVFIEGTTVRLLGAGPEVGTELGSAADQWASLAPELRTRRATEIARRLVAARRAILEPKSDDGGFRVPRWVAPLFAVVLGAVGLVAAWKLFGPGSGQRVAATPASQLNADQYEAERRARAQRVCESTASRVMRGAVVGPTDVEGWVVELVLARDAQAPDPLTDPALAAFLAPGDGGRRFVWTGFSELSTLEGIDTSVELGPESLGEGAPERGIRLTFGGKYVAPYFRVDGRREYVKAATAMAEKLSAKTGALYARCALGSPHYLGAWFYGPTPGDAAAALIYWIGAFGDPPQVRQTVLFPDGGTEVRQSRALERIRESTKSMDRTKIRNLIGEHGGMIAGQGEGATTLSFPFADANRAGRSSYDLARISGVGVER